MIEHQNWMKLVQWSSKFRPGAKRLIALPSTICLLVSANSAYASGVSVLPPVVVHPVHSFTTPVHFSAPDTGSGNQSGSSSNPSGSNSIVNTSTQRGNTGTTAGTNGNLGGGSGSQTGGQSGTQTGSHTSSHTSTHTSTHNSTTSGAGVPRTHNAGNNAVTSNSPLVTSSQTTTATPSSTLPSGGYQLDLSSTTANIVLGSALFNGHASVTINVGGTATTFAAGSKVTAAEYVAIQQALSPSGSQTLTLNQSGATDGGQFTLNKIVNANVTELVVPQSVTALDFSSKGNNTLTIAGDLTNYGSVFDVAKQSSSAVISAEAITNEKGGVISTLLPGSLLSSFPGAGSSVSLTLNAINDITNSGTISSSSGLTLSTSNGAIANSAGGTLSAASNINLSAGSGNLSNAGTISSHAGNINITAPGSTDLTINGAGGTFQADAGNINVRTLAYTGNSNVTLSGGNYLSENLNVNAGNGSISGSVGQVSGNLNTVGDAAHFSANTSNLVLGSNEIKGDPTYVNTGNITIAGPLTASEDLTILAGGNITASGNASINTSNSTAASPALSAPGTDITLVAGANVSVNSGPTPGGGSTLPGGTAIAAGSTGTVDFNGGSGGNIDLTGSTFSGPVINTSSTLTPGSGNQANGGNVVLAAYGTGAAGTGQILLPGIGGTSINASSASGNGGNVTLIAGNTSSSPSINVQGAISTTGGAGGNGGSVSLFSVQPGSSTPTLRNQVTFDSNGNNIGGNSIAPFGSILNEAVLTNGINTSGNNAGSITVAAGNFTDAAGLTATGTNNGGSAHITALQAAQTAGITTNAGAHAGNIYVSAAQYQDSAGLSASGGTGGNVNISASAGNISMTSINTNATTGNAGNVTLGATGSIVTTTISTSASGAGGYGGANGGTVIASGQAGVSAGTITTQSTSGLGGDLILTAGNSGNAAQISTGSINTSGASGGLVELVNSAGTNAGTGILAGNITANSTAGGSGGSVAVVATANIVLGSVSTQVSGGTSGSFGGGVFISSSGSGPEAISATGITTSAGTGDPGNVIVISSVASSKANPTNISAGTITGGLILVYGLDNTDAPTTIPSILNITDTAPGGAGGINIHPGGYQAAQGSASAPLNLSVNTNFGDPTMVAPINIGATGASLFIGSINQVNGKDNVNIVTAGDINTSGTISTVVFGNEVGLIASGNINLGGNLNLAALGNVDLAAFGNKSINGPYNVSVTTGLNINVGSPINTSGSATSAGGAVQLSAGGAVNTSDITTSAGLNSGAVSIASLNSSINIGNITTSAVSPIGAANAGNVVLAAAGAVTTGIIDTHSFLAGNGGSVTIDAGSTINTQDINTTAIGLSSGAINLTAGGGVNTGNLETYTLYASNGNAAAVTITSGAKVSTGNILTYAGVPDFNNDLTYPLGNAGNVTVFASGNIASGDINSSFNVGDVTGSAGNVVLVSTGGNIGVGSINTSSYGWALYHSGSVALEAANKILADGINTSSDNILDGPSIAGNVFVSGGGTSGNIVSVGTVDASAGTTSGAGTTGSIFLGANVTGTNGPSATTSIASGPITFSLSNSQTLAAANPYLFFSSSATIPADVSVVYSTSATSVNINPGVYASIGTSGSPVALVLNLGGDSRTLVPIAASGNMFLSGVDADNPGAAPYQNNNGYNVYLVGGGGITLSGNVSSNPVTSGVAGSVNLATVNGDAIAQTAGTVSGSSLGLFSNGGNIGSSGASIQSNVTNLSAVTVGNGSVYASNLGNTNLNIAAAGLGASGTFSLLSNNNLMVTGPIVGSTVSLGADGFANVGTAGAPVQTIADNLGVNSTAPGNFFFANNGDLTLTASTVVGNLFVSTSGQLTAAAAIGVANGYLGLTATGSISAANTLSSNSDSSKAASGIILNAGNAVEVSGLNTSGTATGNGGDVVITATNGIQTGNVNASSVSGGGGSVMAWTGNAGNAAHLTIGNITTSGTNGGLVEAIDSAATSASGNFGVGAIITDATGVNGAAGPVALVATGGILVQSISAQATAAGSTAALGGGVFISSGTTNQGFDGAIDAAGTITTSALGTSGNVILISSTPTTGAAPTNINHGTITGGSTLIYGLDNTDAPTTIPTQVNVTTVAPGGGADAINIHPGGYQTTQGSAGAGNGINLTVNTLGNTQMLAPINVAAQGVSLFLNSITQSSGSEHVELIAGGNITTTGAVSTAANTSSVEILAAGSLYLGGNLTLNSASNITVAAAGSDGISGPFAVSLTAPGNVHVLSNINTSQAAGDGQSVTLSATNGGVLIGNVNTSSGSNNSGSIQLNAGTAVIAGELSAIAANTAGTVTADSKTSLISTGDIFSFAGNNGGTITLTASDAVNGAVSTGQLLAYGANVVSGNIVVTAGTSILATDINTATNIGGSFVTLDAGTSVTTGNIFNFGNQTGGALTVNAGANVTIANVTSGSPGGAPISISSSGGGVTVGAVSNLGVGVTITASGNIVTGDISTQPLTSTRGPIGDSVDNGAPVIIDSATGNVAVNGGIYTFVQTAQSALFGGAVNINAGQGAYVSNGIFTGALYSSLAGASGGNISVDAPGGINLGQVNTSGSGNGGSVSLLSNGNVFTGGINTSSSAAGTISGNGGSVTILGNSVQIVNSGASEGINTSAVANTGNAGSVTLTSATTLNVPGSITTTASGFGGNVTLAAGGTLTTGDIDTSSNNGTTNSFNSGNVAIQSTGGSVTTGNITTLTGTYGSFGFMGNGGGGNVTIAAATSITAGTIDTDTNYTNGNSGSVVLSAGTTITTDDIKTFSQYGFNSGSVSLNATGAINTGNIESYAYVAANGNAGSVTLISGSSITTETIQTYSGLPPLNNYNSFDLGNAGNVTVFAQGNISTGDINASFNTGDIPGSSGNVVLVSTGGGITVGTVGSTSASIDTSTFSYWINHTGSVSLVASKSIDVLNGINTFSINPTLPAIAGNIFVSGGSTSGTVVTLGNIDASATAGGTAGSIFLGANVTGTNGPSATSSLLTGPIQFALVNSQAVGAANPYLFYNTGSTTIAGTVSVIYSSSPTSVNINPGVYSTIGSSGSPVALTLNLGGDSRTLVPIAASSDIYVSSISASNNGVFSNSVSSLNGYNVYLVTGGTTGLTMSGSITSNPLAGGVQGSVYLGAVGSGSISQTAGTVNGASLNLLASGGNIGSAGNPIQTNVSNLSAATDGSGSVYISNLGNTNLNLASAGLVGGTFSILSNNNLAVFTPIIGNSLIVGANGLANVGTAGMPIQTLASNLTVNGVGRSNFFFANDGALTLDSSSVLGNLSVTASGNLATSSGTVVSDGLLILSAAGSIDAAGSLASNATAVGECSGIQLTAGNTITTVALTTTGSGTGNGGDIIVLAPNGIATGAINSSAPNGNAGSVIASTGNVANAAVLSTGGITANGQNGGLVELINSSATTSSNNLTVAGNIASDATGASGAAGPIALVASGGISAQNISAQDTAASGTAALGGGVFISSGGTGATAIDVGTITTSAPTAGSNNSAGNVIVISSVATSVADPSNITVGTITQAGNNKGSNLVYGLDNADAPTTLPAQLNVTTVAPGGGADAINIHPGGYQTTQGSSGGGNGVNLVVNTDNPQMLAPINIGATGVSLFLNSITQKNNNDNIDLILSGDLTTTGAVAVNNTAATNSSVELLANGSINLGGSLTLASGRSIDVAAPGTNGIDGPANVSFNSSGNLNVLANINTSTSVGSGGAVTMAAGHVLVTGNIYTSSTDTTDTTATGGNVSLTGGGVVAGNIYTPANSSNGNGGSVIVTASTCSISTGDIETSDQQYYLGNAGAVTLTSAHAVNTGAIYTPAGYANEGGAIQVTAGTSIFTDDITSGTNMIGGNTTLSAGTSITTGNIYVYGNTSGGALSITAGTNVTLGDVLGGSPTVPTIQITSTGGSVSAQQLYSIGSPISVTAATNISTQDILTTAETTTGYQGDPSIANGGPVTLSSATGSVSVNGGIYTYVQTAASALSGGSVTISGVTASVGNGILSGATLGSVSGATGGDVLISTSGLLNSGPINTAATNSANSGTVTLNASGGSGGPITSGGINAGSQTVTLTGTALTNDTGSTISGGTVTVTGVGAPGSHFVFTNNGLVTANNGNLDVTSAAGQELDFGGVGTFSVTGPGTPTINFTATDSAMNHPNLVFLTGSDQNLLGVVNLNANGNPAQAVIAQTGALADGNTYVYVNSSQLIFQGTGLIIGHPLVFNTPSGFGTIANSSGDVNLASNLVFDGLNLAILASGSINTTGATLIDLDSPTANGGSLILGAGFNFTPVTGGQVGPDGTVYTLSGPSAGGSINLNGVNIDTSTAGTGTNAGNVIAAAQGSIIMGNIDATATNGKGGNVTLIAPTSITAGTIDVSTTSGTSGGVTILGAAPILNGTTIEGGGQFIQGGFTTQAGTFNANIVLNGTTSGNAINAPGSTVTITTGGTGAISTPAGGQIVASTLLLTAGSGGIGVFGTPVTTSAATISAVTTGNVYLANNLAGAVTLNGNATGNTFQLLMTGTGSNLTIDGLAANNVNVSSTGAGSNIILAGNIGGQIAGTDANSVTLSANGSITNLGTALPTPAISTTTLNLTATTGEIGFAILNPFTVDYINTDATTVTARAGGFGASPEQGVFINDTNTAVVTFNALTAGDGVSNGAPVTISANAVNVNFNGQVFGSDVYLQNDAGSININNTVQALDPISKGSPVGLGLLIFTNGNLNVNAPITSNDEISILALANGNINLAANVSNTGNNVLPPNLGGTVIQATGGNITQTAGVITDTGPNDAIVLIANIGNIGTASAPIVVSAPQILINGPFNITPGPLPNTAGDVFVKSIYSGGSTVVGQSSANNFQMSSVDGITIGGFLGSLQANTVSLSALNSSGVGINLAQAIVGSAGAGSDAASVALTTNGSASIQGSGQVNTNALTITSGSGNIGTGANPVTQGVQTDAALVTATTLGNITINDVNANGVTISGSGNAVNLAASSLTIRTGNSLQGASVTLDGAAGSDLTVNNQSGASIIATTGNVTVNGAAGFNVTVNNAGAINAQSSNGNINITSTPGVSPGDAGGNLTILGGGTMNVNAGSPTSAINLTAGTSTDLLSSNAVNFTGNQTFNGATVITASGANQQVEVQNGVLAKGNQSVTVNSPILNLIGTGMLVGNPLIFNNGTNSGTIANSTGSINLSSLSSGQIIFHGKNLLILAAGSIQDGGNAVTIDVSNASGNGGNLTLLAGYNFTPGTGSTVYPPNNVVYTLGTAIPGSNISLGDTTITTGGSGTGGNVLAVANGSITLDSVNTTSTGATGTSGNVTLTGQGVTVGGSITTSAQAGGTSGSVTVNAAAPVTNGGPIVILAGTATGGSFQPGTASGSISLAGVNAGSATATLNANASGATINSSASVNAGTLLLSATSGAIGSAAAPLPTNATTLTANAGTAGSVFIADAAASTVTVTGTNAANSYNLTANGSIQFSAAGALPSAHDLSLTSTSATGTITLPTGTVSVTQDASGNGGSIMLVASNILDSAPIVLNANATGAGNGGSITVTTASSTTIGSGNGDFTFNATGGSAGSLSGDGGSLSVTTNGTSAGTGTLTVNSAAINIGPLGTNGKGATIDLTGFSIVSNVSGQLALTANGTGSGGGGTVALTTTNAAATETIGTGTGSFALTANSGATGVNGGTVSFTAAGDLVVAPAQLSVNVLGTNGNGGTIDLVAGTSGSGTLLVNGSLNAAGTGTGSGGTLNLQSDSAASFLIGSAVTNGVTGSVATGPAGNTNGGTISVTNKGGDVVNLVAISSANDLTLTAGGAAGSVIVGNQLIAETGSISLNAAGTGSIAYNTVATALFAGGTNGSISFSAPGGTIGSSVTPLSIDTPVTNINASGGVVNLLNFFDGGQALNSGAATLSGPITYNGTGNITINGVSHAAFNATGTVNITSGLLDAGDVTGNIAVGGNLVDATGTVNLTTSGTGTFTNIGGATVQAGTLNLHNAAAIGSVSTAYNTGSANLSVTTTGLVNIENVALTGVTLMGTTTTNSFTLGSNGNLTIATALTTPSSINLSTNGNNGSIIINQTVGGTATTGGVTLSANGSGQIKEGSSGAVTASPLTLSGAGGGIFLNVTSTSLSANGTGVVSLGDLSFATATVNNSSAGTSFSLGSNGSLVLNNIAASKGFINVLSDGALLQTNPNTAQTANNGSVLLQNANIASGTISIGSGSFIGTSGTGGPVEITIGAPPTNPIAGTKPATVTVNPISGGQAFFGTNSISVPTGPVTLNLKGSNIVFNTGSRPATAIIVGPNVTITADPIGSVAIVNPPSALTVSLSATTASLSAISANAASLSATTVPLAATADIAAALHGDVSAIPGLSSNAGLVAAMSSVIINSATAAPVAANNNATVTGQTLSNANNNASMTGPTLSSTINNANLIDSVNALLNSPRAIEGVWMSDTELSSGKIPALLSSDEDLGVLQSVSSVVELEEQGQASEAPAATIVAKPGAPLTGSVSRTAGGVREMKLNRGSVVFAPKYDTVVYTPFGNVKIDAGSIVLIMAFHKGLAVYDLADWHGKAVVISAAGRNIELAPGLQAVITNDSIKSFDEINPAQLFGYGHIKAHSLGQGQTAFVSEFSLPQALTTVLPLKQLVNSSHPHARKTADRLLKTTSILQQMHAGSYEQVVRRSVTAYSR